MKRCQAVTKENKQCKNLVSKGESFCHLHKNNTSVIAIQDKPSKKEGENTKFILKKKSSRLVIYLCTSLINGLFLVLWAAIQIGLFQILHTLNLTERLSVFMLEVLRTLFAFSTIIPIAINIYSDTKIMLARTREEIRISSFKNTNHRDNEKF